MGSCVSYENKISQIEAEIQMLNSETRIQNDHLLREISILKQLLQIKKSDENRRYSYNPVIRKEHVIIMYP